MLAAEEELIIDIIEALNDPVAPGFCFRDKDRFHTQVEAQSNEEPEAAGVTVGASEGQLIVHLEPPGDAQPLPGRHESLDDINRPLAEHGLQRHSVTEGIDEVDSVEPLSALEIARTHQVQLVKIIRLPEKHGGIRLSLGDINRLDHQAVPFEDPVNCPDLRQGINPQLLELPLDGQGTFLGVLCGHKSLPDFADQTLHFVRGLRRNPLGSPGVALEPIRIARVVVLEPIVKPTA